MIRNCILLLFSLFVYSAQAQILNPSELNFKDSELWIGVELSKDISKSISIDFSQNVRFNNNWSKRKNHFSELGLSYSINKTFKANASLRYIENFVGRRTIRPIFNFRSRILNKDNIKISHRFRWQKDFRRLDSSQFDFDSEFRNKFIFSYELDKFDFSVFTETFNRLFYEESNLIEMRFGASMGYKVRKRHSIGLGYTYKEETNITEPGQSHILRLGFSFEIR